MKGLCNCKHTKDSFISNVFSTLTTKPIWKSQPHSSKAFPTYHSFVFCGSNPLNFPTKPLKLRKKSNLLLLKGIKFHKNRKGTVKFGNIINKPRIPQESNSSFAISESNGRVSVTVIQNIALHFQYFYLRL